MAVVPTGTIEDHHGMGISSDLAADLAEVMVHRDGIADRHDQRRRLALRRTDRTKHIGRGEAEVLWCRWPAAGLPPHPGQGVLLADARLVLKPYLDRAPRACTARTRSNCNPSVAKTPLAPSHRPPGGEDAVPTNSTLSDAAAGRCSTDCNQSQTPLSICVARRPPETPPPRPARAQRQRPCAP